MSIIYSLPRPVASVDDCIFYHTIDIPGYGTVEGPFDFRKNINKYFGGVDLKGERVLELGTADGYLGFMMEQLGAEVISYDLSEKHSWDIVPYERDNRSAMDNERKEHLRKINNAFWFCHSAFKSKNKMVYGPVYDIPEEIGEVDVATFGAILLHLRDPFLALQNALRMTKKKVIITDPLWKWQFPLQIFSRILGPFTVFLPDYRKREPKETWWFLSIAAVQRMIGALGFEKTHLTYHFQKYRGKHLLHYTLVGERTKEYTNNQM
jgi:hypothetical protein